VCEGRNGLLEEIPMLNLNLDLDPPPRRQVATMMESMRSIKNIEKLAPNGRIDATMVATQLASL
jgi:hypothetical protein